MTGPVVDNAGVLSPDAKSRVENIIRQVHESGGTQIAVLTVPSLEGISIEEAGIKVADKWKLGKQDRDDGVLLLVAPNDRRVRIEVGRGKEGDLPDAYCRRIITEIMTPAFRAGGFDDGVLTGVAAIVTYTDPTFDLNKVGSAQRHLSSRRSGSGGGFPLILIIVIAVIAMRVLQAIGLIRPRYYGGGGWYGGGGGGWGGGGSSGGGWSGGGGGFGGGGSSGQW